MLHVVTSVKVQRIRVAFHHLTLMKTERHFTHLSLPCLTSKMKRLAKMVNGFWPLNASSKHSIFDVSYFSEYAYAIRRRFIFFRLLLWVVPQGCYYDLISKSRESALLSSLIENYQVFYFCISYLQSVTKYLRLRLFSA